MGAGVDVAVIGAGVIGAAVAAELARAGRSVWLLEQRPKIGGDITERNSGVIHAGLYDPPSSLKTRLCIEGARLLYAWAEKAGVPHRRCGKLIVATDAEEEAALAQLLAHARAVGVEGLRLISSTELAALEPDARGVAALLSPNTGIVDPYELTRSLVAAAESDGAEILVSAQVRAIHNIHGAQNTHHTQNAWTLETTRGEISARAVVNAAGLYADDVARLAGIDRYVVHPCRGDYFRWHTRARIAHLLYPVKKPSAPGLGVHLTLDLAGGLRFGPDADYVAKKDDYAPPLEEKRARFAEAAAKILKGVKEEDLEPESCGIRPKLRAPDEAAEKDFVIAEDAPGFVNLVGIESPGLTSALAIAREVAAMLGSVERARRRPTPPSRRP
ncbi:MAG: NAD(P)/FAD-dependent oxidoreductase [Deltaproteobacteria bacterium]|nr:NAD(P)/FAD-dependent oxidoreductase [Deltaproteobacteria bacterium]